MAPALLSRVTTSTPVDLVPLSMPTECTLTGEHRLLTEVLAPRPENSDNARSIQRIGINRSIT